MQLDDTKWKLLFDRGSSNAGRNVYIQERHLPRWEKLKREHVGNYYLTSLLREVRSLNALSGGYALRPAVLTMNGGQIQYIVNQKGDVHILLLNINESIRKPGGDQTSGLYQVNYNRQEKRWRTHTETQPKMELSHRWNNIHYATVSGKFKSKEEAGRLLPEHICNAYKGAIRPSEMEKPDNHYSLYWLNDTHKDSLQRDNLVSLIQQVQAAKVQVNWLVHGDGALTFVNALKVLETYPGLTRFQAQDEKIVLEHRRTMGLQGVYFSNPRGAGVTEKELKRLCDKVGLVLVGINRDARDMWNADSRKTALDKIGLISAKGVVGGPVAAAGLTAVIDSLDLGLDASTGMVAGAAVVGGGIVIAKDSLSTLGGYARSVQKSWGSTFGEGNKRWAN